MTTSIYDDVLPMWDLEEDILLEVPCEGQGHPRGIDGHDGGPAAFIVLMPCRCIAPKHCAGRVAQMKAGTAMVCAKCRLITPTETVLFIRI
jgi:hypothetical protein